LDAPVIQTRLSGRMGVFSGNAPASGAKAGRARNGNASKVRRMMVSRVP
jgi:hypothetical protein